MVKKKKTNWVLWLGILVAVFLLIWVLAGGVFTGNVVKSVLDCQEKYQNFYKADLDGDRIIDLCDNAPSVRNRNQRDRDGDGVGDVVDACPGSDKDHDGVCDSTDNCPTVYNPYTSLRSRIQRRVC